jgi:hypothetical protein
MGNPPPRVPRSYRHFGVWRPHFAELLTEWLIRLGLPRADPDTSPRGAVRIGVLKGERRVVRCTLDDSPDLFHAEFCVRDADADDVIVAGDYSHMVRPAPHDPFSTNGEVTEAHV